MRRGVLGPVTASGEMSTRGDCEVQLLALGAGVQGPVLTFSVGWELVGVWDGHHCCAVLDRALLRLCLPVGVETSWTVDELSWWSSTAVAGDFVLIGLGGRRALASGVGGLREPAWWRLSPAELERLRERV